jgi:hypothetical protein
LARLGVRRGFGAPTEDGGRGRSEKTGATFVIHGGEKVAQDADARRGKTACGIEANLAWQLVQTAAQGSDGVGEAGKAGIAADLAHGAQDADSSELLEDVGVAQNRGFEGGGGVFGLVLPYGLEDGGNFGIGEAGIAENRRGLGAGVGDVIPAAEGFRFFRAVADEDAEIVKPGGGADHVLVVMEAVANRKCKRLQAGLVAELIHRPGLFQNETLENLDVTRLHRSLVPQSI